MTFSRPPNRHWVASLLATVVTFALVGCSGTLSTVEGDEPCTSDAECGDNAVCRSGSCFALPSEPCEDLDGDGFFRGPGCSADEAIDCDDGNESINPGVTEICDDGVDQNCFGGADELCPCEAVSVGTTRDCGQGTCQGIQTCADTGWGECVPLISPQAEQCGPDGTGNDRDEDCNGIVDDGCGEVSCPERPDGMGDELLCPGDATCSSNGICL